MCAGDVGGRGGASGERRLSKVRRVVNWCADSNEMCRCAMRVLYSVGGESLIGWLPGCGACFDLCHG